MAGGVDFVVLFSKLNSFDKIKIICLSFHFNIPEKDGTFFKAVKIIMSKRQI